MLRVSKISESKNIVPFSEKAKYEIYQPGNYMALPLLQSEDGPLNRSSNSFDEISSGCGEDPLRNSISSRNCISNEAANDKIPHEKQQVKSRTDGLPTIKDAQIEQKLSKYLDELNLISDQLREAIQPFESSDSPNIYNNDASPLQVK